MIRRGKEQGKKTTGKGGGGSRDAGGWFVVVSNRMVKTASSEKVKLGKDEMRDPSNREPQSRARAVQEKKRNIWRRSPQLKSPLKFRQFTEIQRSE